MTTSITDACSTRSARRLFCLALFVIGACSSGGAGSGTAARGASAGGPSASSAPASATTAPTTAAPATTAPPTTAEPPISWPTVDGSGPGVYVSATGVVLPVDGSGTVETPCSNTVDATGTALAGANVVLDPGHGGNEPGAQGPTGLVEKDVNLAVALDVQQLLEAQGATVVLTRTGDYNTTIKTRADVAVDLHPQVFLSIHHNAEPDGPSDVPGNESYYQIASADSKRLAGLVWEEITAAFTPYHVAWAADTDHGAKYRPGSNGGDYYGILRRAAGVTTVLSEAAFITNPPEEQLLADPGFRHVEAQALTRAVDRYVTTADPGSGFVEPYPRTEPAGGGGGPEGCVDPPL